MSAACDFCVKTAPHEPTLANATVVRPSFRITVGPNAAISGQPGSISGLFADRLALRVELLGFKGSMIPSKVDSTAAQGVDAIAKSILVLRGQNILLDRDLAALYGVTTKRLNEQVKRNLARFPIDFMFQLTAEEEAALRSHFATSSKPAVNRGGRRYLAYAFTEQGVAMLSSVLSTERAVAVNIEIMRAFVRMRGVLAANKELARRFAELESRLDKRTAKQDKAIAAILSAIRELMNPTMRPNRGIGFTAKFDE
jgi:phage regulator Rha-like protein